MQLDHMIRTCSIWRALEVVGDTPTLLILEACWLGTRHFSALQERTGLLKALLSDRLKQLTQAGLLETRQYNARPPRYEYLLTAKGRDLYWTSLMLLRWEQRWGSHEGKIRIELTHKTCGHVFEPTPACGSCGETIDATQVDWTAGPGVGLMRPVYSRRRQQRASAGDATSLMEDAAQLMGDRWASLIMRSVFTGLNRFEEIRQDTAIATNILSDRLNWLIGFGVLRARQYATNPPRDEYRLTRKGVDYYPVLLMLMRWGDKYYCAPEGPPLMLTHKHCGKPLDPQVVCSHCRQPIRADDVTAVVHEARSHDAATTATV